MNRKLVKTKDESYTLYVPELDEHYHSIHGALQESRHVFINAGLFYLVEKQKDISLLEVGFGTGLNAFLTRVEAERRQLSIKYCGLEKYPLTQEEYSKLHYYKNIGYPGAQQSFEQLHKSSWDETQMLSDHFIFTKLKIDFRQFESPEQFDLIYFDAFAPSAQADLWTAEVFSNMYNSLKTNGILVTYCVKGDVRRAMRSVGFRVEKLPGPPGKREMLRAYKK